MLEISSSEHESGGGDGGGGSEGGGTSGGDGELEPSGVGSHGDFGALGGAKVSSHIGRVLSSEVPGLFGLTVSRRGGDGGHGDSGLGIKNHGTTDPGDAVGIDGAFVCLHLIGNGRFAGAGIPFASFGKCLGVGDPVDLLGDLVDFTFPGALFGGGECTGCSSEKGAGSGETISRGKVGPHGTVGVLDIVHELLVGGFGSESGLVDGQGDNGLGILVGGGDGGVSVLLLVTNGGGDKGKARDGGHLKVVVIINNYN